VARYLFTYKTGPLKETAFQVGGGNDNMRLQISLLNADIFTGIQSGTNKVRIQYVVILVFILLHDLI
jgi:hypothetical protein